MDMSDVASVVCVLVFLLLDLSWRVDVKAHGMWTLHSSLEQLKNISSKCWSLSKQLPQQVVCISSGKKIVND